MHTARDGPLRAFRLVVRLAAQPLVRLGTVGLNVAALVLAAVLGMGPLGGYGLTMAAMPERSWQRSAQDPRWVRGQVDLAMPAPAVWQRFADVRGWPSLFSDIASFSVKSESSDGARWVVRFASRIVGHGAFDYFVTLDSAKQSGRVVVEAPGVRGAVYASVTPIDDRNARVTYATFADRYGVLGWFLSERSLHARQERLVEQNLTDLGKAFGMSGGSP